MNLASSYRKLRFARLLMLTCAFWILSAAQARQASALTRQEAIDYVVNTIIDTMDVKPILRGYALQNPIPSNSLIAQNVVDTLGTSPAFPTWFFWLDLKPIALFAHDTMFILVNADGPAVDFVQALPGDLWPTINAVTYYETETERETSPDLFWADGGTVPKAGGAPPQEPEPRRGGMLRQFRGSLLARPLETAGTGTWGLIVSTIDTTTDRGVRADVLCAKETFDSLGVTNITYALNKNKANTLACIDSLPNDCAKLYVFWIGHGKPNQLVFSGETPLSAKDFACKLKDQGADEYCVIMETCFSGSFLDELADKGVDGFHTSSTSDSAYTSIFRNRAGRPTPFDGAPYGHYLWDCLQGGLRGIDAHQWADSLVQALRDSLTSSADSTRWRKNWGGKYANDDDAQGEYVHTFGTAGTGASGAGEPFSFRVARGCSTVCMRFPGSASSDTCGNFTLSCQVQDGTAKKWVRKGTYNWNLGKTIYFRTYELPNATGEYMMTMHSNKGGVRVGITWLQDTSKPVTEPNSYVYNANSVGWLDGSSQEFNQTLGQGSNGIHLYDWVDGVPFEQIPAHVGPNWFVSVQTRMLLEVDPDRPELYNGNDPTQGFAENTLMILQPAALFDPETGLPVPFTTVDFLASQPTGDSWGPITVTFEDVGGTQKQSGMPQMIPPAIINLGTIFPAPFGFEIIGFGPGVVAWDAILMMPESGVVTDVVMIDATPKFRLAQNEPNPFNPRTTIRYELPRGEHVELSVFDVRGRLVRTLVNADQARGSHLVIWDGRTNQGSYVSSGVYLYRLQVGSVSQTRKMTVVR